MLEKSSLLRPVYIVQLNAIFIATNCDFIAILVMFVTAKCKSCIELHDCLNGPLDGFREWHTAANFLLYSLVLNEVPNF